MSITHEQTVAVCEEILESLSPESHRAPREMTCDTCGVLSDLEGLLGTELPEHLDQESTALWKFWMTLYRALRSELS